MRARDIRAADAAQARRSARLCALFGWYLKGYFRKRFRAIRVLSDAYAPACNNRPFVVYANHPSWFDPIVALFLARALYPDTRPFGPIDAEALKAYGIFERLGFYPVEAGTPRGAAQFLRTSAGLLACGDVSLWMTPQGQFVDARVRPVVLKPGLARLVRRAPDALYVPLALEYPFWDESKPEALAAFGPAISGEALSGKTPDAIEAALAEALETVMSRLGDAAQTRDAAQFETLLAGGAGVGGPYDVWRRILARLRGERFDATHEGIKR